MPVIEIPSLLIPDRVDIVVPPNLVVTSGDIIVPSGTGSLTDGNLSTPQDLNVNGGDGATLISNTPLNAGADANVNGGTLVLQDDLTTVSDLNVNPGSSLVVDPPGSYTYLGVAPFTEDGAESLNLRVGQQNLNSLQLNVGGRLAYTWSLSQGKILLIPQVRMFWNHEFLQNSTSISSDLDGGVGPAFNYRTINPSRDSVFAGAGLIAQLGRNWNASVYYNTDFGSATSNTHIVSSSVGFLW